MGIGIKELLIILLIVGLVFGTKKLRGLGGDLGTAIKSFRNAFREEEDKPSGDEEHKNGAAIEGGTGTGSSQQREQTK
jgi:twin arginine-targeting protein translocase, TatA/E family